MKNSGLQHRFNQAKLRAVWTFNSNCFWCEETGFDCFHHIISPSSPRYKKGQFNSSILNACPIHNFGCHLYNPKLRKKENEKKLLEKVIKFLVKEGYGFTKKDLQFYEAYKDLYSKKGA